MRPASYSYSSYQYRASLRSRLAAFVLAAAIVLLLLVMLMRLGIFAPRVKVQQAATTLELLPGTHSEATRAPTPTKGKQAAKGASGTKPTRIAKVVPQPNPPPPKAVPWNVMPLSHSEMSRSDISTLPTHASESAANGQAQGGNGTGAGGQAANGSGEGPGGAQLYNAEWYRKPTRAEMDTYMPHDLQPGAWGEVVCKTIARYHVEDCRELGEAPGSGMSRAMREASWQFLVTPPRVGGRALIGAWVRIRYYIVPLGSANDDDPGGGGN